jgi:transposase
MGASLRDRACALRAEPLCVSGIAASPLRRALLTRLYLSGMPFRLIAREYGGTATGVRSTVRKMRERGVLPDRAQPVRGQWA